MRTPWPWAAAFVAWLIFSPAWTRPLQDPDLWWLLWAGEQLLDGHYPRHNGLAWTTPDHPWTTHEPLVATIYAAAGLERVGLVRGALLSATGLLLTRLAWARSGGSAWATILALLWSGALVSVGVSERALAWGDLGLAAALSLTLRPDGDAATPRWTGPALAAGIWLWAQSHGSFVLGIGLAALYRPRWAALGAGLTLLNPSGFELWALVLGYGTGGGPQGIVHLFVEEWRPLVPPTSPIQAIRLGCLLLALGLALTARGAYAEAGWRYKLFILGCAALALKHARYVDPAGIALLPAVAARLGELLPRRPLPSPAPLLAAALALTALASPRAAPDPERWPPAVLAALEGRGGPGDRSWADFELGAWLAWRAAVPAFWDSRNDCYPVELLAEGVSILYQEEGWLEALDSRGVRLVVTRRGRLIAALEAEGWREIARAGEPAIAVMER